MDFEHLKFKPRQFDGVWANASLHHIPKKHLPAVFAQICRILKNGGVVFVKVKYGSGEGMRTAVKFGKQITRYFAYYRVRELNTLLRAASFKILSSKIGPRREWIDIYVKKRTV